MLQFQHGVVRGKVLLNVTEDATSTCRAQRLLNLTALAQAEIRQTIKNRREQLYEQFSRVLREFLYS